MSWHSVNPIMPIDLLIPERLEFRNFFSGFRTGNIFACECPKFQVAGPLPRVYLDTIQEMLVIKHYLTPCCRDVVPFLPLDRPPNMHHDYSTVLSFHEQICCAAGPIHSRCGLWPFISPSPYTCAPNLKIY